MEMPEGSCLERFQVVLGLQTAWGGESSLLELSLGFAGGRHEMIKINF